jgi:regulator of protease activity HflC (stomatin/prohibitin superfamily)
MIFNQGQFLGELTDDQQRQIAASRAQATGQAAAAAEAAGALKAAAREAVQASSMDQASRIDSILEDPRIRKGGNTKWLVYGGAAAGAALLLFLASRPSKRSTFHSRRRPRKTSK